MKTIILASSRRFLENKGKDQYLPKSLNRSKILYITTATNKSEDIHHVIETREIFKKFDVNYTEFDILGKSEDELKKALSDADIVYIEGGNTFFLLKAIRETGFDKLIKEAVNRGVVYWGASAGSYVACPSITMATWTSQRDKFGITDLTGMNLVPFVVKAHYKPEMMEAIKEKTKDLQYPLHILTDDQGIVVRDGVEIFIGGEETVIK